MTTPQSTKPLTIVTANVATKGLRFKPRATTSGVTVHCSATKPSQDWGAQEVDRMHRNQGWLCIGYHYVIRRDGTVELGRPVAAEGSHCRDGNRNKTNIGICLIGGVSEKPQQHTPGNKWNGSDAECNFTAAQMVALKQLLAHLKAEQFGGKDFPVEGHRDVPGVRKACPSFQVSVFLKTGNLVL
jgi:N-acetylmuramoyl-L-alanine amidase